LDVSLVSQLKSMSNYYNKRHTQECICNISIYSKTTYSFSYTEGIDRLRKYATRKEHDYATYMIYDKNAKQESGINIFAGFEQNFEELKMSRLEFRTKTIIIFKVKLIIGNYEIGTLPAAASRVKSLAIERMRSKTSSGTGGSRSKSIFFFHVNVINGVIV